ncbi:hypothetical protein F511_46969 [Dorcoceras hygrometricum]|uniref:Uncharacterized protein n=1 Tax=Dorcoceras hygrometricum TaxID=472368 RepID=A0A2Z6ZS57_9LAMI|nr:hypothetical protein F511_46969 [Dorcoceras hygrometricum]
MEGRCLAHDCAAMRWAWERPCANGCASGRPLLQVDARKLLRDAGAGSALPCAVTGKPLPGEGRWLLRIMVRWRLAEVRTGCASFTPLRRAVAHDVVRCRRVFRGGGAAAPAKLRRCRDG